MLLVRSRPPLNPPRRPGNAKPDSPLKPIHYPPAPRAASRIRGAGGSQAADGGIRLGARRHFGRKRAANRRVNRI
jgi:hypothetical protein